MTNKATEEDIAGLIKALNERGHIVVNTGRRFRLGEKIEVHFQERWLDGPFRVVAETDESDFRDHILAATGRPIGDPPIRPGTYFYRVSTD